MTVFAKQNGFHDAKQILASFWLLEPKVLNLFSYLSIRKYREVYLEVYKVIFSFLASE